MSITDSCAVTIALDQPALSLLSHHLTSPPCMRQKPTKQPLSPHQDVKKRKSLIIAESQNIRENGKGMMKIDKRDAVEGLEGTGQSAKELSKSPSKKRPRPLVRTTSAAQMNAQEQKRRNALQRSGTSTNLQPQQVGATQGAWRSGRRGSASPSPHQSITISSLLTTVHTLTTKFSQEFYQNGNVLYNKKQYSAAFTCYKKCLIRTPNHAKAHFKCALIYSKQNTVEAWRMMLRHYEASAKAGYANAYYNLALIYRHGYYEQKANAALAVKYFTIASKSGHASASLNLGLLYHAGQCGVPKDHSQAYKYYSLAKKQGDGITRARAEYNLGFYHEHGLGGCQQDNATAFTYYLQSALQKIPQAECAVGYFLEKGKEPHRRRNIAQAMSWYEKAAENGSMIAQLRLGVIYHEGIDLPRDTSKAYTYFSKASNNNFEGAIEELRDFSTEMSQYTQSNQHSRYDPERIMNIMKHVQNIILEKEREAEEKRKREEEERRLTAESQQDPVELVDDIFDFSDEVFEEMQDDELQKLIHDSDSVETEETPDAVTAAAPQQEVVEENTRKIENDVRTDSDSISPSNSEDPIDTDVPSTDELEETEEQQQDEDAEAFGQSAEVSHPEVLHDAHESATQPPETVSILQPESNEPLKEAELIESPRSVTTQSATPEIIAEENEIESSGHTLVEEPHDQNDSQTVEEPAIECNSQPTVEHEVKSADVDPEASDEADVKVNESIHAEVLRAHAEPNLVADEETNLSGQSDSSTQSPSVQEPAHPATDVLPQKVESNQEMDGDSDVQAEISASQDTNTASLETPLEVEEDGEIAPSTECVSESCQEDIFVVQQPDLEVAPDSIEPDTCIVVDSTILSKSEESIATPYTTETTDQPITEASEDQPVVQEDNHVLEDHSVLLEETLPVVALQKWESEMMPQEINTEEPLSSETPEHGPVPVESSPPPMALCTSDEVASRGTEETTIQERIPSSPSDSTPTVQDVLSPVTLPPAEPETDVQSTSTVVTIIDAHENPHDELTREPQDEVPNENQDELESEQHGDIIQPAIDVEDSISTDSTVAADVHHDLDQDTESAQRSSPADPTPVIIAKESSQESNPQKEIISPPKESWQKSWEQIEGHGEAVTFLLLDGQRRVPVFYRYKQKENSRAALVLMNDLGDSSVMMAPAAIAASKTMDVYAFDQLGHGRSHLASTLLVEDYQQFIHTTTSFIQFLVEQFSLQSHKIFIMAQGLGAAIALHALASKSLQTPISGLLLVNVSHENAMNSTLITHGFWGMISSIIPKAQLIKFDCCAESSSHGKSFVEWRRSFGFDVWLEPSIPVQTSQQITSLYRNLYSVVPYIKCPLMWFVSGKDNRCSSSQCTMQLLGKATARDVSFKTYKDGYHYVMFDEREGVSMLKEAMEWICERM